MDLGTRHIRSSGRGSGSVEMTLPSRLRALAGFPCRVSLRDGPRPEIVLEPDLADARDAFARVWPRLAAAILAGRAGSVAMSLPLADLRIVMHPDGCAAAETPMLAWFDGRMLAAAPPHPPEAICRSIAGLSFILAEPAGIGPALAALFAAACGFAVSGSRLPRLDPDAAGIIIAALSDIGRQPGWPLVHAPDAFSVAFWQEAAPMLTRVYELFLDWSARPGREAATRRALRRAAEIDMARS